MQEHGGTPSHQSKSTPEAQTPEIEDGAQTLTGLKQHCSFDKVKHNESDLKLYNKADNGIKHDTISKPTLWVRI